MTLAERLERIQDGVNHRTRMADLQRRMHASKARRKRPPSLAKAVATRQRERKQEPPLAANTKPRPAPRLPSLPSMPSLYSRGMYDQRTSRLATPARPHDPSRSNIESRCFAPVPEDRCTRSEYNEFATLSVDSRHLFVPASRGSSSPSLFNEMSLLPGSRAISRSLYKRPDTIPLPLSSHGRQLPSPTMRLPSLTALPSMVKDMDTHRAYMHKPAPPSTLPPASRRWKDVNDCKKPRCHCCSKKLKLCATYACKCQGVFCGQCRIPEAHQCSFDFKTEGTTSHVLSSCTYGSA